MMNLPDNVARLDTIGTSTRKGRAIQRVRRVFTQIELARPLQQRSNEARRYLVEMRKMIEAFHLGLVFRCPKLPGIPMNPALAFAPVESLERIAGLLEEYIGEAGLVVDGPGSGPSDEPPPRAA
jgi:hypothetical protein